MIMNRKLFFKGLLIPVVLMLFSFRGEKDALNKKIFTASVTEIRDGKPKSGKPGEDEIEFKDGKVFSTFCFDKLEWKWIKYNIVTDTTFIEEDSTETRKFVVEASSTNEKDETLYMNFVITNYEIEGSYKLTKRDIPKKLFEFQGREKVKKSKK